MPEKCWKDKNLKFLRTLIVLLLIQFKAYALIEVDITRGNLSPLPVAVSPLASDKKSDLSSIDPSGTYFSNLPFSSLYNDESIHTLYSSLFL